MLFFIFLFSLFLTFSAFTSPWKNLKEGDQAAQELLHQMDKKKAEGGAHPFYNGKTPPETHLKSSDLEIRSKAAAHKDSADHMIVESMEARAPFKLDPTTDPLLRGSQFFIDNPLLTIGGEGTRLLETTQSEKDQIFSCDESGEGVSEQCIANLHVQVVKKKVRNEIPVVIRLTGCKKSYRERHLRACEALLGDILHWRRNRVWKNNQGLIDMTPTFKSCLQETLSGKYNRCRKCTKPRNTIPTDLTKEQIQRVLLTRDISGKPRIEGRTRYCSHRNLKGYDLTAHLILVHEEEVHEVLPAEWILDCDRLEEKADQGLCVYRSTVCTQGRETRLIDGVPVTQDCWQEARMYDCTYPSKDDCGPLRAKGCVQIDSRCKKMIGKTCVVYAQTYQCKGGSQTTHSIVGGNTPFCLDGTCRDQTYESNDEMMSTLSQLTLLKEIQGNFKKGMIFKGNDERCSRYIFSFKDCCGSGKGWGKDLGLSSCKTKEKTLSKKRKAGLCHRIGTYCEKKILGQCVEKKTTYCCFSSKLLKVLHEQGRLQIKLGWGKADKPLCRGFTIAEIQRIDFSKLDLREVFEDLMKNFKSGKQEGMRPKGSEKIETADFKKTFQDIRTKSKSTQLQDVGKRVGERLETLKGGMSSHAK
ncbi:MAG: conjugal transfer protein TraN [Alphaproteobacteria bacterium]|nr:conjugal transfer protein TraN [Alphaproteobacteria bacterium]